MLLLFERRLFPAGLLIGIYRRLTKTADEALFRGRFFHRPFFISRSAKLVYNNLSFLLKNLKGLHKIRLTFAS